MLGDCGWLRGRVGQRSTSLGTQMTGARRSFSNFGLLGIASLLLALLLFGTTVDAQIIPSNRVTTWAPGLMTAGGISNRTVIYRTLSPSGGDDTAAIQAALNG